MTSPLITNMMNSVQAGIVNKGVPALYPPDLEYIMILALTELSTDPLVSPTDQATYVAQIALATGDAAP